MENDSHRFNWSFIYNRLGISVLAHDLEESKDKLQDLIHGICGITIDKSLFVWNYIEYNGDIRVPSVAVYVLNAIDKDDNIKYDEGEEELYI